MDIGAALIVKNEEELIDELLKELNKFCDQIVVVDTGSTDKTPVLASKLGAEVYFYAWKDDFSCARNFSLDHIRTEWVFVIDADELPDVNSVFGSADLLNDDKSGGLNVNIKNYLDDAVSMHKYPRIFRNRKDIRFRGRIHEQIGESIRSAGFEVKDSSIILEHSGYYNIDPKKHERNKELLRKELEEKPQDEYIKYHLANTEFELGNHNEAFELYDEIKNSVNLSEKQQQMSRIRLAQIKLKKEKYTEAAGYLEFSSTDNDIEGFRLFVKAGIDMQLHNFEEALKNYNNVRLIHSSLVNYEVLENTISEIKQIYN